MFSTLSLLRNLLSSSGFLYSSSLLSSLPPLASSRFLLFSPPLVSPLLASLPFLPSPCKLLRQRYSDNAIPTEVFFPFFLFLLLFSFPPLLSSSSFLLSALLSSPLLSSPLLSPYPFLVFVLRMFLSLLALHGGCLVKVI